MLTRIKRIHAALFGTPTPNPPPTGGPPSDLVASAGVIPAFDPLEPRQLLAVNILSPIADTAVSQNSAATVVNLSGRYDNPELDGTIARFDTSLGAFHVLLANNARPITVANFLRYITEGRYADTIIHRSVSNFIIQGGGFQRPATDDATPGTIATFGAIQNEPGFSNLRGTIAMAKVGGNANSATSQWFFNLADNSSNLDNQNGGFTVFGRVIGNGMTIVDAIAGVSRFNADSFYGTNGLFSDLPLREFTGTPIKPDNFVSMNITTVPELTYSVTSSNSDLVNATLDGNNLTLAYGANLTGSSTVTVRTTAADGSFVDDTFLVSVVGPPSVGQVVAGPQPAVTSGQMMTLTATNITDLTGSLAKVQFFHDANGDGLLDAEDTLLGEDNASKGGYSIKFGTAGLPQGQNRFFARAVGAGDVFGPAASVVHRVVPPPSVGSLESSVTPIPRNSKFELWAGGISLPGAPLKTVEFYRDTNGNGTFDVGIDKKVASASKLTNGVAVGKVASKGFAYGENTFFARVLDKGGSWGPASTVTVAVTNAAPTIKAVKAKPAIVKNVGDPVALSVSGGKDTDGKIVRVQYFRDTEVAGEDSLGPANGEFDENDELIGEVTVSGFKFTYLTTRLPLTSGRTDRYFARAFDNDGGVSTVVWTDVRMNLPPTLTDPQVTPDAGDLVTTFTFSAAAGDPDGVIKSVEFYRDTNGNGIHDAKVDKVIGKAKFIGDRWVLTLAGKKLSAGENRIFVRATDKVGGFSQSLSLTVTLA